MATAPKTLLEAVRYFSDKDVALNFVADLKWPNGVVCPKCESTNIAFLQTRRLWKCRACKKQFSAKVDTIFEDSPIGFEKWLPAMWMIANCKNGISSYELSRALGITQKSAWFMLHRIRLAMQSGTFLKMSGAVEADETFIGGKARNMHWRKREKMGIRPGRTLIGKAIVMGLLERHSSNRLSNVRVSVVPSTKREDLVPQIEAHVEAGATIHTDANTAYYELSSTYAHNVIDHAEKYVDGEIHTNGIENFWSLLKRTITGTYVSIEPFHLFRYLDEQAFRFNKREGNDGDRFVAAAKNVVGRRVTYKALTGATLEGERR